ncbi:hypothetical protein BDV28DRAFT_145708 [Aspergillus coremiiformis]|uniref:Uncharacterized protein n=1 Tax=Aspergillus coremiiformis TaxID=138285 RepID=A0A5N6ZGP6_9EURO|nr:hypothetical protein BDV28DRAFT_145708 [Aspergillus coremiiformis]
MPNNFPYKRPIKYAFAKFIMDSHNIPLRFWSQAVHAYESNRIFVSASNPQGKSGNGVVFDIPGTSDSYYEIMEQVRLTLWTRSEKDAAQNSNVAKLRQRCQTERNIRDDRREQHGWYVVVPYRYSPGDAEWYRAAIENIEDGNSRIYARRPEVIGDMELLVHVPAACATGDNINRVIEEAWWMLKRDLKRAVEAERGASQLDSVPTRCETNQLRNHGGNYVNLSLTWEQGKAPTVHWEYTLNQ